MDRWEQRILRGLRHCRLMLTVLSPAYFTSDYCRKEWERYLERETVTFVVQVNGKVRDRLEAPADADEKTVRELALASERVARWLEGKQIRKTVFVPGKLLGIVAT